MLPFFALRVLASDRRLPPFGDLLREIPLAGCPFGELLARELVVARLPSERLTAPLHAFASAPLLQAFAARAQGRGPWALALPDTDPARALAPLSSVQRREGLLIYDLFLDAPPAAELLELRATARPILVEPKGKTYRRELPRVGPLADHLELPADGALAAHVEHWVHLLWLAPLLVPLTWSRARRARQRRPAPLPSVVAKSARIHPTAYIEASVIEEGCQVAAGCSVRHSFVGRRSRLAEHTKLDHSVLGEQTLTLADATFSHVVSLGEGTLTNLLLRDVLIGRSVFLTSGVIFWGERDDAGNVTVEKDGQEVDTERRFVGGCVGHGSVLGARTIIGPGRALPNRTMVVMRREEGVLKVEPHRLGTPLCWDEAALVPYDRLRPGEQPDELSDRRAPAP